MKKINVINIGGIDIFDKILQAHDDVSFHFLSWNDVDKALIDGEGKLFFQKNIDKFDVFPDYILLSQLNYNVNLSKKVIDTLLNNSRTQYSILYDENSTNDISLLQKLQNNDAISIDLKTPEIFLDYFSKFFFGGQEGSKLSIGNTVNITSKTNKMAVNGNTSVDFEGEFGNEFNQIYAWRYNYVFQENKVVEIWLEYETQNTAEVMLYMTRISNNGEDLIQIIRLSGEQLREPYILDDFNPGEYLFCSVFAKGNGRIKIGQLHVRRSRASLGTFFIGGKRIVSQNRQEVMTYFNPGDRKPPLNVYFSGYRSAEGFEGNFMMQDMGAPYLLITDPRIEGGSFYMGEQNFELSIVQTIKDTLQHLNFENNQLILSGLSMGTYGAFYYAADLNPHAVIVGKPLVNLGNVAYNEHGIRPNGFPTSLDVLHNITDGNTVTHKIQLNKRFWEKFIKGDYSHTTFRVAFMKNDDYDPTAFYDIRSVLNNKDVSLLSKGFVGRHNDNSYAINRWFIKQYQNILQYDFGRNGNNT
ncbi:accessory Sec system protein Asp2 [Leuconostoc gelidum subsp. aenigmaticum]|uniref:accessory Sec system protein Asp2 n=1 Tax=Leuconostoc gelidum TaxID=1244 RepID=UPI001CC44D16|nr:accessory Sec system protein Asp2 [Leuconostoc gelidum]MBZ6003532.1 accessory Sec system protein Asp2 [Leuconostoc gelidum subsp. aenigmaticum]